MAVSGNSLIVCNRGGRPKSDEPLTPVTIWVSHDHFERMRKLAELHDLSMSRLGRKVIERAIDRSID